MKWHHSLYWRIAVGFVACLALLLLVQAMLFVWVVSRSSSIPNQPPDRFAQTVALDASQALERDPALDLAQYLRQEYGRDSQPFFVLLRDGSLIEINGSFPDPLVHEARARFEALVRSRPFDGRNPDAQGRPFEGRNTDAQDRPFGRRNFPVPDRPYFQGRPFDRGGFGRGGPRPFRPALIRAHDEIVALVVVPPAPPFMFLLARYAPTL